MSRLRVKQEGERYEVSLHEGNCGEVYLRINGNNILAVIDDGEKLWVEGYGLHYTCMHNWERTLIKEGLS